MSNNVRRRAFSLLEILVVVVILSLLTTMVAPKFQRMQKKSRYSTSVQNLMKIADAMEAYYLENGAYPVFSSWDQLVSEKSPLHAYANQLPTKDNLGQKYGVTSTAAGYKLSGLGIQDNDLRKECPPYQITTEKKLTKLGP